MMGLVRGWLLGITGAAILAALAEGLMPEGGVKQIGKLVCGLVLLLAVLRPFGSVELTNLSQKLRYDEQQLQQQAAQLQEEADARMKAIIEEQLAAYSMDKAAQLGIQCQVRISCAMGENGVFLPASVQVHGVLSPEQQQNIVEMLQLEFGVEAGNITFRGGETP